MKTERIGTILERVVGATVRPEARAANDWDVVWNRVAGERLRAHSYVSRAERGSVVVKTDGSAWLFELTMRKSELARAMERESGRRVRKLSFVI